MQQRIAEFPAGLAACFIGPDSAIDQLLFAHGEMEFHFFWLSRTTSAYSAAAAIFFR